MFCLFSHEKNGINSEKCIEYGKEQQSDQQPQRGRPERAELLDVNINTGAQSINTESFFKTIFSCSNITVYQQLII